VALTNLETPEDGIALLTLCDPASKNALSREMVQELEARFQEVAGNPGFRVMVLGGSPEIFCSGASREVLEEILAGSIAPSELLLPRTLLDVPVPVIAAMAGHALGGGLALGLYADIILIARESRYGANFMDYGFTPGMGVTRLLTDFAGPNLAQEMLLTGRSFRGAHFEGRGNANYILPGESVLAKALEVAALCAEKPRRSLIALKTELSARKRESFEAARSREILMHQLTFDQPEVRALIAEKM
jgi:polyketide biosynthesis enoyl-CoA hydratase PksI